MQKLNNESLPQTVKKLQRKNLQKFTAVRETGVSWHHEVPIEGPTPRTSQHYIVSTGLRGAVNWVPMMMMIAPNSRARKIGKEWREMSGFCGRKWGEEGNANHGRMVQLSEQHFASCVKGVRWGLGTRGLRMIAAFWVVVVVTHPGSGYTGGRHSPTL